ncbi:MAG: tyrosine--tRNA ligase [Patescibacteria group bacterium]
MRMDKSQEQQIEDLLTRGVEQIFPSKEALKEALSNGRKIKLYCGFDPSASSLHIGNAIQINKLSQFQDLGHEVIFLIGDFTGMIGDPTDKSATRKKLTREEVLENAKNYQKQAEAFLRFDGENPAKVKYNSEWSDKVSFKDLIEITSNFTVGQMIQRDMFQERVKNEKPIYLHEFLYPVAQGYDSVAMDVDLELGGNDQMFNMLCGRDLMKAMRGKEKFVMTTKLLADDTGKKMGKSEGNAVFLDQEPFKIFENIMNWSDGVIGVAFELCTKVPFSEVKEIQEGLKSKKLDPRETKMRLAFEFVKLVHGEDEAQKAKKRYEEISFSVSPSLKFIEETEEVEIPENTKLTEFLVKAGLATSNSDARRKIEGNAVEIDLEKEADWQRIFTKADDGKVVKVGRGDFVRIRIV